MSTDYIFHESLKYIVHNCQRMQATKMCFNNYRKSWNNHEINKYSELQKGDG